MGVGRKMWEFAKNLRSLQERIFIDKLIAQNQINSGVQSLRVDSNSIDWLQEFVSFK